MEFWEKYGYFFLLLLKKTEAVDSWQGFKVSCLGTFTTVVAALILMPFFHKSNFMFFLFMTQLIIFTFSIKLLYGLKCFDEAARNLK